jgi:hypothetical protein
MGTMSVNVPSEVTQPVKGSVVRAFLTAPMLVKVLAGSLYLSALLAAVQALFAGMHLGSSPVIGPMASPAVVTIAALWALISFFLGEGVVRGSHRTWILTLVLSGLWLLYDFAEVSSLYSRSRLQTVITVAVLALLFSPTVRRHCTKTARR